MVESLPKYKQLRISLKSDPEFSVLLYSVYEECNFEDITEIGDLVIAGVPSKDDSYSEELFEYKEDAQGIFEKFRIYETKNYIVNYNSEKAEVSLSNEKELAPTKTAKGQISFRVVNYLGKSSLSIIKDDIPHIFPFEIVPIKIDYDEDYVKLTDDIAQKCSSLLLDYASPTNLSFNNDASKRQETPLEMFIFIRKFCSSENIEYLLQSIKNNPDRQLVSEEIMKPFGTAPISKKFFSNPFSYGKNFVEDGENGFIPELVSSTRKYDSYDTPANRFVKFALNTFSEVCQNVIDKLKDDYSYKDEAKFIKNQIENVLYDPFFDDVQALSSMPFNNQVLQKREGYAQIFNAFNMLDLAKQLDWKGKDDVYEGQARNVALLYEYWLVFKFMEILQDIGAEIEFDISDEDHKQKMFTKENGLLISLKEGKTSYFSALIKEKNLRVKFYYNRTFGKKDFEGTDYQGSYSRDFRPDYTLAIFPSQYKEDQAIKLGEVSFIHFDAKYRVTDITSLFGKEQLDSEDFSEEKKQETIDTYNRGDLLKMHTYNDAIRKTIGSYVLYPGKSNKENKFNVYDELLPGVGAFAIRPGDTEESGSNALRDFISDIIDFKSQNESRQYRKDYFENAIIKGPGKNKESKFVDVKQKEYVLCGMIRYDYLNHLNKKENHYLPTSESDTTYLLNNSDSRLYFYYHAIKDGAVYALHPNTNEAKYFCGTTNNIARTSDVKLENWTAEIEKSELVSASKLIDLLKQNSGYNLTNPKADFYYLVTLKNIRWKGLSIAGTIQKFEINIKNLVGSPYSPKIISIDISSVN